MFITSNLKDPGHALLDMGDRVEVPTWQSLDVRGKPQGTTVELENVVLQGWYVPTTVEALQLKATPNLPWAENQFLERVAGKPLNPGETYKEWPWYRGNVEQHKEQGKFSHTYMERYWPKGSTILKPDGLRTPPVPAKSVGDLNDVVRLLAREPTTRQAYLPVWFPTDTGAVHGERVPCSLGYLFLLRDGKLNITYYIRSCDFLRHFRDDVYMTARLCQWVLFELQKYGDGVTPGSPDFWDDVMPGRLTMHIGSLHVFAGDLPKLRREYGR
jgi:thymidylate synthase